MYGDNLPPGCTIRDIERQCGDDDDGYDSDCDSPGMDPDLWDDRSGVDDASDSNAADDAATSLAVRLMREMMGLPALPTGEQATDKNCHHQQRRTVTICVASTDEFCHYATGPTF
jgi:hypothetical protein